ncbi:hypothetical protein BV898_06330 [Hypsibius exemplaris]|uniref:N-acetyltransferase domain-containing protein n=1 Tax=Hypsibius exemplaris TaxID=2072580 RepID=A0A1W0WWJ3_HYPEX|nr:hypothetical protein BV898_06330 [Hypsibius exemplaris]
MFLGVDTGCVHVIKEALTLFVLSSDLPEGLQFGEITENHAQQICGEWKYGTAESLPFSRYILRNRFPSSGVFTQDGRLVAYILYRFDGMMFSGFVHPDVRRLGLFQAVNYNMVEKLASSGQDVGLLTVEPFNAGSLASNAKLGAKKVDPNDYGHECYKFTPVLKF